MDKDFGIEVSVEGIELVRENVERLKISSIEGLCAANLNNPLTSRDASWYKSHILDEMIKRKEISDGFNSPYDDRKMRLDYTSIKDGVLKIALGFSHYNAFRTDLDNSYDKNEFLKKIGIEKFNDRWAFFSRAPGVLGLIISNEGSIFLGERLQKEYSGLLNSVAGHIDYKEHPSLINLEENVLRETNEEVGISPEEILKIVFVGGYLNINCGDMDFAHLVFTNKPNKYFLSGEWAKKINEREHKSLFELSSYREVQDLLCNGRLPNNKKKYNVMYSTRGALQSLKKEELAN